MWKSSLNRLIIRDTQDENMLTEEFVVATQAVRPQSAHTSSALKDVGVFLHEFQPQAAIRQGFKKSSAPSHCLAVSESHIFTAQAERAVINVYSREKGNQEATVPFPQRITSLIYLERAAILVLGTQDGRLLLWETATGRISTSAAAHLEAVLILAATRDGETILSACSDSSIHVWHTWELVSFSKSKVSFHRDKTSDSPANTFSQHREGVSALVAGRSSSATNFAVSASVDKTCYIWHTDSCQTLRTILLLDIPRSLVLDPADRAIYIGSDNGGIQHIDIFRESINKLPLTNQDKTVPLTLTNDNCWKAPREDVGPALSITLSYDGTVILTGHYGGQVIRWDVAKRRVMSEVTNLLQSVTNIQMIVPPQLRSHTPNFCVPSIVKPRLELNTREAGSGSTGIPSNYTAQVQVLRDHGSSPSVEGLTKIDASLLGNGFNESMLEDAAQALLLKTSNTINGSTSQESVGPATNRQLRHVEKLEDEMASLKSRLATQNAQSQKQYESRLDRMKKRDALGFEKRQAFFAAKTAGKDGDVAMKPFADQESMLDAESDEEIVFSSRNLQQHHAQSLS